MSNEVMQNKWKALWSARSADMDVLQSSAADKIFLELKRSNGFDSVGDGLSYQAFMEQYATTKRALSCCLPEGKSLQSLFEVGCGSGANLFLFEQDGIACGGIDYSPSLITCAKQVLRTKDILCAEASDLPIAPQYDAVLSNGVFSYFSDESYAADVLEKMYQKAVYSIGIIDIHDSQKKDAFQEYRKARVADYEEKYKDLPKLFYSKEFFIDFARSHSMKIEITSSTVPGYWNNEFVFNCYMYKC